LPSPLHRPIALVLAVFIAVVLALHALGVLYVPDVTLSPSSFLFLAVLISSVLVLVVHILLAFVFVLVAGVGLVCALVTVVLILALIALVCFACRPGCSCWFAALRALPLVLASQPRLLLLVRPTPGSARSPAALRGCISYAYAGQANGSSTSEAVVRRCGDGWWVGHSHSTPLLSSPPFDIAIAVVTIHCENKPRQMSWLVSPDTLNGSPTSWVPTRALYP